MANVISTAGYRNVKLDLTTATATKLYSVPTNYVTVVESIMVSEDSGNADTITVTITNGSSVFSLFKVKAVGANATVTKSRSVNVSLNLFIVFCIAVPLSKLEHK